MTPVPAISRINANDRLQFGAAIIRQDSLPTDSANAYVFFWAMQPLRINRETYFYLNRHLIILADNIRLDRGNDLFRTTSWASEILTRSIVHKATIQVSLDDLAAIAAATSVEGQVGAVFEFKIPPHVQRGLAALLDEAGYVKH